MKIRKLVFKLAEHCMNEDCKECKLSLGGGVCKFQVMSPPDVARSSLGESGVVRGDLWVKYTNEKELLQAVETFWKSAPRYANGDKYLLNVKLCTGENQEVKSLNVQYGTAAFETAIATVGVENVKLLLSGDGGVKGFTPTKN